LLLIILLYFALSVIVIHIAIISSEVRELYFSSFNYSAFHWKCELHSSIINNSDLFLPVEKSLGHGSVAIRRLSYTFNGGFSPLTFTNASPLLPPRNYRTESKCTWMQRNSSRRPMEEEFPQDW